MITKDLVKEKTADLEKEYFDFMVKHFGEWKVWANVSQKMADGEKVKDEEVPEAFMLEFKLLSTVLEMEAIGKFDWNNPKLRELFVKMAQSDLYRFLAKMVTEIALRLADLAGVKTFVEIGAGRGNLTEAMLKQMAENNVQTDLIVTDADPVVFENIEKLNNNYPQINIETLIWDINKTPSNELLEKIQHPCLSYERSSMLYTNIPAIENIARVADIVVFEDMYNYTGKLYAYDEIAKRIGAFPLFYSEMKPFLDECFHEHFMFDLRAQQELNYPNTTMLIALK